MQTYEASAGNSKPETTTSGSLTNTPVTKRSKLSTKKNRSQSPGRTNNVADQDISPLQSPVLPPISCTSSQNSGTNGRSPLSNNTNYNSLQSTPNRGWLSSQEPQRDILWDNTSPINSRGQKAIPLRLSNFQELYKNWTADNHGEDGCLSQKHATSDKWLSMNNSFGNVAALHIRDTNFRLSSNQEKQISPLTHRRATKPSKHLSKLLESLQKPHLKGPLKFEEAIQEEPREVEVLAPSSDPDQKDGKNSTDDLWGEEDISFLAQASQCFDQWIDSTSSGPNIVISSTLSSENSTGSSSKNVRFQNTDGARSSRNESRSLSISVQSSQATNSARTGSVKSSIHSDKSGGILCRNFYDLSSAESEKFSKNKTTGRKPGHFKSPPLPINRKPDSIPVEKKSKNNCRGEVKVRTFDEGIRTVKSQIGMPGAWMSPASIQSTGSDIDKTLESSVGRSPDMLNYDSQLENGSVHYTKVRLNQSTVPENKRLPVIKHKSSEKAPERTKCISLVTETTNNDCDDNSFWEDIGIDIFSQESIEFLDKIEREAELDCETAHQAENFKQKHSETQNSEMSEVTHSMKNTDSYEDSRRNPNEESSGANLSNSSSQLSDTYKRQYTRMEINRKKAEALRRRRLREETQQKAKLNFESSNTLQPVQSR